MKAYFLGVHTIPDYGYSKDALRAIVGLSGQFVGTTDSATLTTKTIVLEDNTIKQTTPAAGSILHDNGTKFVPLALGAANKALKVNSGGTDVDFGTLPVAGGGTGAATLTGIVKASGTSAFTAVAAPTGALVGDSDTQNLSAKTLLDPVISLTQTSLPFRRTNAGDMGVEFGSNHASGGAAYWDFHISSADGDYSSRFIRNSGTNGTWDWINTGTGLTRWTLPGGIQCARGSVDTTTSPLYFFNIDQTIATTGTTAANHSPFLISTQYNATNPTDPFDLAYVGEYSVVNYGTGPAGINPIGSVLGTSNNIVVAGSGHVNNETANFFAVTRVENAAISSTWMTDWNIHGPIAAQPGLLSGINMFVNNYYNGSPSRNSSYGLAVQTKPGTGGGGSAAHTAATTYKLDMGIAIQGFGGTVASPARGYEVGLAIGGSGSNWVPSSASKIGTGIKLADIESIGIEFSDPAVTTAVTPAAIKVTAATRAWDIFLDLSIATQAPTTAAIKLGANPILGTTMKTYEVAANVWDFAAITNTSALLRLVPNISSVASTASRGNLRIVNNTGANSEYLNMVAAGTNGFIINATKDNAGTVRDILIQADGTTLLTFVAATTLVKASKPVDFEDYTDQKVISAPADPAAGYVRVYPKAVDANNDGLFVKLKIAGTVTEVQLA